MCCVIVHSLVFQKHNLQDKSVLPSGYSWSLWKMAPWPRSVDKAEEAGSVLAESEIFVRLARETTLVIEG